MPNEYCRMGDQLTKILRDREFLVTIVVLGWSVERK